MRDEHYDLSWDEWDEMNDPRPAESGFDQVVEEAIWRRGFLGGVLAFGSGAAVMGTGTLLSITSAEAQAASRFAFNPIPIQTDFTVHVPEGYSWKPLARWGTRSSPMRPSSIIAPAVTWPPRIGSLAGTPTGWSCST